MFDLHHLTVLGMIVIAVGTLVGTFLLQRGNALKGKESSDKLKAQYQEQTDDIRKLNEQNSEIKLQNENLKTITQEQNILLKNQGELLRKQLELSDQQVDFLRSNANIDFFSNLNAA